MAVKAEKKHWQLAIVIEHVYKYHLRYPDKASQHDPRS